jgi:hypothetical protein
VQAQLLPCHASESPDTPNRYEKSFKLATANIDFGNFVKAFRVLVAVLTIIVTITFARRSAEVLFARAFLGVVVGLALYTVRAILAAQGEALRAILDSATDTAMLLGHAVKARIRPIDRSA